MPSWPGVEQTGSIAKPVIDLQSWYTIDVVFDQMTRSIALSHRVRHTAKAMCTDTPVTDPKS